MNIAIVIIAAIILLAYLRVVLRSPFVGLLVTIPFVTVTRSVDLPVVGERIILFDIFFGIWILGCVARSITGKRVRFHITRQTVYLSVPILLFVFGALLSLLDARSVSHGLVEVCVYVFLFFIALQCTRVLTSQQRIVAFAHALIAAMFFASFVGIWEALSGTYGLGFEQLLGTRNGRRITGPFRNPNQLAAFIVAVLPLSWCYLFFGRDNHNQKKFLFAAATLLGIIAVVLTSSRTSFLALVLQLLVTLSYLVLVYREKVPRAISIGLFALLLFLLGSLFVPKIFNNQIDLFLSRITPIIEKVAPSSSMQQANMPDPFQSRFFQRNLEVGWLAAKENPLLGTGLANFGETYRLYNHTEKTEIHSQYLSLLAEAGMIGSLPMLLFLLLLLRIAVKNLRCPPQIQWLSVGLFVSLLGSLAGGGYIIFLRRREFWIIAAMIVATSTGLTIFRSHQKDGSTRT